LAWEAGAWRWEPHGALARQAVWQRIHAWACSSALGLRICLAFQHQQVAPVDVIARARQVHRRLFVPLDGAGQQPILHGVPHIRTHVGLGAVRGVRQSEIDFEHVVGAKGAQSFVDRAAEHHIDEHGGHFGARPECRVGSRPCRLTAIPPRFVRQGVTPVSLVHHGAVRKDVA
jgi:hypothetical protein